MKVLAVPSGINSIEFDENTSKEKLLDYFFVEVKIVAIL